MKKLFCAVLLSTSFFANAAMNPRDTDDQMPDLLIRRSSSDLRVNVLRHSAHRANSSPQRPVVRSPRLNTDDDKNNVVPNLNAAPKKLD